MTKLSAQEEAERLWSAVELAVRLLPERASVDLGGGYPADVVRALATLGGTAAKETLHLEPDGRHLVCVHMTAVLRGVYVTAGAWRPATPSDVALQAYRHSNGGFVSPEEAAKALGVSP